MKTVTGTTLAIASVIFGRGNFDKISNFAPLKFEPYGIPSLCINI